MKLNLEYFHATIFNNFRLGLTKQECIDDLNSTFYDEAPLGSSVYRWFNKCNRVCRWLNEAVCEVRLKSSETTF